jgi:hypothetical protein
LQQGLNVAREAADTAQAVQTADSMLPSQLAPGQVVQGLLPSQAQGLVSGASVPAAVAGAASTVVGPLSARGAPAAATAAQVARQGISAPAIATQLITQGIPAAVTGTGALGSIGAAGMPSATGAGPTSVANAAGPAAAAVASAAGLANQASAALGLPASLPQVQLPQPPAVQLQAPQLPGVAPQPQAPQLQGMATQPQMSQQLVQPGNQQIAQPTQPAGMLAQQPAVQPQQVAGQSLGPQSTLEQSDRQLAPQQLGQQPQLLQSQPPLPQPAQQLLTTTQAASQMPKTAQTAPQLPATPASTVPRGIQPPTAAQVQQTAAPLQRAADSQLQQALQPQSRDPQWINRAAEFYARNGQQAAAESLRTASGGPTTAGLAQPTGAASVAAAAAYPLPAASTTIAGAQATTVAPQGAPQGAGGASTSAQVGAPTASAMSAAQLTQPAAGAVRPLTRGEAAAQAAIAAIGPNIDAETAELARSTGAAGSYRRFPVGPPLPAPPPSAFASAPPLSTGQMQAARFTAPPQGAVGQPYTQQAPGATLPVDQGLQPAQAPAQVPSVVEGPPESDLQGEGEVWVPLQDSQQMLWVQEGVSAPMRAVSARTLSAGSAAEGLQLEGTQPGAASATATMATGTTVPTNGGAAPSSHGWGPMKTLSRLLHHKKPAAAT